MGRRSVLAAVVVASLAAGCSASDDPGPGATVPQGTTASSPSSDASSSAPAVPDVSAIPATIDKPYLEAVLKALDETYGDAVRLIRSDLGYPQQAARLLSAIYSDEAYAAEEEVILKSIARNPALSGIRPNPGNRVTTVDRIIKSSPACAWLAVKRDASAVNIEPGPDRINYLALEPLDGSNDPDHRNPTAWMITFDAFTRDGSEPPGPCT